MLIHSDRVVDYVDNERDTNFSTLMKDTTHANKIDNVDDRY